MRCSSCFCVALAAVACAGGSVEGDASSGGGGGSATATGAGGGSGGFLATGGFGGGSETPSVLYVHSNETLFRGDPADPTLALEQVGNFDCIGGAGEEPAMTDIAVDRHGTVWAVNTTQVFRLEIQGSSVHCAEAIDLQNPTGIRFYGLAFAPVGVLHPDEEVLVGGNSAGELWQIDEDGNLTQRGTFGLVPSSDGNGNGYAHAGEPWELSGDIVFFENGGSPLGFATVRDCPDPPSTFGCNETDTLIELDVAAMATASTQSVTKSVRGLLLRASSCSDGASGYGRVYGIAGFEGQVLGFSRDTGNGLSLGIDNSDGTACARSTFNGLPWAGAGITTVTPVTPPPPK